MLRISDRLHHLFVIPNGKRARMRVQAHDGNLRRINAKISLQRLR